MIFSSLSFLLQFLPIFLLFYLTSPKQWKNAVALVASLYFYAWGAPAFALLIVLSLLLDYYLVQLTALAKGAKRKRLLWITLALDLSLLFASKYLNFTFENINTLLGVLGADAFHWKKIVLPIGISFITFQRISYVLDCYAGRSKPVKNFFDYALYILLFPQLIAGPIVRYNEVVEQLDPDKRLQGPSPLLEGMHRFLLGLAKKMLLANTIGLIVDEIFGLPMDAQNTLTAWLGIVAYSFQIYYDFSAYSDMAIGLARMMGFRFPENFHFPYVSQNITEFWRRWHITLGNWMRDYLYIPLGGNRGTLTRTYANLAAVFLISGLWHGAAWTFVIWGAFHGLFLILDRLFLVKLLKPIGKVPRVLINYVIVLVGWVFFRSPDFTYALAYIAKMFSWTAGDVVVYLPSRFGLAMFFGTFFAFWGLVPAIDKWAESWYEMRAKNLWWASVQTVIFLVLGWMCLFETFSSGFNPFIYFKF